MRNRDAVEYLDRELRAIFERRLHAFVVYGQAHAGDAPVTTLAVVDAVSEADLRRCADRVLAWRGRGLATPLFLDADEFARSLDAFPFEFGAILADHEVISGRNPFEGLSVDPADLRRACEVQARSHLLHLREGYLEAAGRSDQLAELIVSSAAPLAALLAHLQRLPGPSVRPVLARVCELVPRGTISPDEASRMFGDYLDAVDALVDELDRWHAR